MVTPSPFVFPFKYLRCGRFCGVFVGGGLLFLALVVGGVASFLGVFFWGLLGGVGVWVCCLFLRFLLPSVFLIQNPFSHWIRTAIRSRPGFPFPPHSSLNPRFAFFPSSIPLQVVVFTDRELSPPSPPL